MIVSSAFPWAVFVLVVSFYCAAYAPCGIDNNDTGFILGLSHQIFLGGRLYEHVVYVRPPVSPILHAFVFFRPFSLAPVLVDRLFVFLQLALSSALSALVARRAFSWTEGFAAMAATAAFVLSAHVFPPMAWHTIDGIFFSVLALYFMAAGLRGNRALLVPSALCGVLAAGSKQPFLLVPAMLLILVAVMGRRWLPVALYVLSLAGSALLFFLVLGRFASVGMFWTAISAQTTGTDLLYAGFGNYLRSLLHEDYRLAAWPLLALLPLSLMRGERGGVLPAAGLVVAVGMLLGGLARFYLAASDSYQPLELFNSLFVASLLGSLIMLARTRAESWLLVAAMHGIAWCASISWGYLTPVLYSAPMVIAVAAALEPWCRRSAALRLASLALLPGSLALFWIGHGLFYSLEAPVRRSSITAEMGRVSPALSGIRGTPEQYGLYSELMRTVGRLDGHPWVVLPDVTFAHLVSGTPNPLGIDWALNTEVGPYRGAVAARLDSAVEYAIVYRKASPRPDLQGKFGSEATMRVVRSWRLIESGGDFSLYANPAMGGR